MSKMRMLIAILALTIIAVGPADARKHSVHRVHAAAQSDEGTTYTRKHRVHRVRAAEQTEEVAFPFFNPFMMNDTATNFTGMNYAAAFGGGAKPAYSGGRGGRPRAWCGWWARQQVGADPGPEYNLVASWRKWGSRSGPTPGAIAIWRGARHVGKVVSVEGGQVCTTSGNSGRTNGGVNTRCEPLSHFEQFRS